MNNMKMPEPMAGTARKVGTEAETLATIREILTDMAAPTDPKKQPKVVKPSKSELFSPLREEGGEERKRQRVLRMPRIKIPVPRRKHVVLSLLLLFVALKPMWAVYAVAGVMALVLVAFLLAGGEKIWRGVMLGLHQLAQKDPERAVRIRSRLDAWAMKWDSVLDWFPDGAVDGLYMPDFQVLSVEEARKEQQLQERIQHLMRQG